MGISKTFKLTIIQEFYANGKSRVTTKRFLVYHTEWDKEAKNMYVRQISRIMNNFESRYTLTNEKILPKELKKYPYRIDSEIVLFCSVLWQMEHYRKNTLYFPLLRLYYCTKLVKEKVKQIDLNPLLKLPEE